MKVAAWLIPLLLTNAAFAADPADRMAGTWKYNPEKSQGGDTAAGGEWKFEKLGPNSWRQISEITLKSGEKRHTVATRVCDGQAHENDGGIVFTCDPNTLSFQSKRDGKLVLDVRTEFSADGRTVTYHRKLLDKDGKWIEDTRVWEKQ